MNSPKTKRSPKVRIVQAILVTLVLFTMAARGIGGDYYAVFLCGLTLVLFWLPRLADRTLGLALPGPLEIVVLLFIFSAAILGELGSFYTAIPWWDTMLHTLNGFLMGAIGFAAIDLLNNSPRFHISLSPIFAAFVAFCFSMTVGVAWEFFEYAMDLLTASDMQKDRLLTDISSVALHPQGINDPIRLEGILRTELHLAGGGSYTIAGGYLDLGLADTMKDLLVNCAGALIFSVAGMLYLLGRSRGRFLSGFIPKLRKKKDKNQSDFDFRLGGNLP